MPYDLLLKGGHVLDPGQGLDGQLDVAISGGRIAAIQPEIEAKEAAQVLEIRGANRYVVPGLIDLHTHVAYGATTPGVGLDCSPPDLVGVYSGVTTVVDTGSVGVTNVGVFSAHLQPKSKTRILVYLNIGSYALTLPRPADVMSMDEVDREAIAKCVQANPGLISGIKLRVTGPFVVERGEELIRASADTAREHGIPFMAHIGNRRDDPEHGLALTRYLLNTFQPGDILTHLCTPHAGRVLDEAHKPVPELAEARARGVVLDPALGRHNFGYQVARAQADLGLKPDTISTDITPGGYGEIVFSLMECMAKFMSIGYSLGDVVHMTTSEPAKALGMGDQLGALAVGREADVTIFDVVPGRWRFTDTLGAAFTGEHAIIPAHTVRAGELIPPNWGPHPWGWLPEPA
jgi:dihydroorotase